MIINIKHWHSKNTEKIKENKSCNNDPWERRLYNQTEKKVEKKRNMSYLG